MRYPSGLPIVVLAILVATAPTLGAQEAAPDPRRSAFSQASIHQAVTALQVTTRRGERLFAPRVAPPRQQPPSDPVREPTNFLTSPKGIAVLVVLGVGVGYAAYSKVHDRIHSKNPDR